MSNFFSKYWPIIITLAGALGPVFSPAVQSFYAGHPTLVAAVAGAWASFKWALPSPLSK